MLCALGVGGAIRHRGAAFLDVISPCVAFNNHPGSTKSYDYVREHNEAVNRMDVITPRAPIVADYKPGELKEVRQQAIVAIFDHLHHWTRRRAHHQAPRRHRLQHPIGHAFAISIAGRAARMQKGMGPAVLGPHPARLDDDALEALEQASDVGPALEQHASAPRGDQRAWPQYPCVLNCASPLAGKDGSKLTARQVKLNLGGSVHDPSDPIGRSR